MDRGEETEQARWDEQMDRDAAAGKLDFLSEEAESDLAQRVAQEKRY
jgi:hypothetical protein